MPLDLNISGMVDAQSYVATDKLKIAIVGKPKTGKSWLAATAPGPVFVADFDDRAMSLAGKKDVYVKTYVDRNPNNIKAMQTLETDLAAMEYAKSQGKEIPKTIVLDSATYLRAAMEQEIIRQQSSLGRGVKIGNSVLKIASGWDAINGVRGYFEYLVGKCSELANLIVVFHEQDEKDNQRSTKEEKAYTGRVTVQPQYLSTVLSTFNEVWRVTIEYGGKYQVEVRPNNDFLASTTLKLDAKEEPNIQAMLEKHRKAIGK